MGCLRILSDGYFFGTITELLILPEYQKKGIGSQLLQLAKENAPTMLYFGSQPGIEAFYEKNGCQKSLQSYMIEKNSNNNAESCRCRNTPFHNVVDGFYPI